MEISNRQLLELTSEADRRLRATTERLFPPTWFGALKAIARAATSGGPRPSPRDTLDFLMTGEPHTPHADDPEASFDVWLTHRADFPRLLTLWESMLSTQSALTLVEPESPSPEEQAEWRAAVAIALRLLVARSDHQIAMICLDAAQAVGPTS